MDSRALHQHHPFRPLAMRADGRGLHALRIGAVVARCCAPRKFRWQQPLSSANAPSLFAVSAHPLVSI